MIFARVLISGDTTRCRNSELLFHVVTFVISWGLLLFFVHFCFCFFFVFFPVFFSVFFFVASLTFRTGAYFRRQSTVPDLQDAEKEFRTRMPVVLRLLLAVFDALMSHTELVCYFAMILNHLVSASLLSIVYPFSVFLWAMLSVPRPDKFYWVCIMTYTEVSGSRAESGRFADCILKNFVNNFFFFCI